MNNRYKRAARRLLFAACSVLLLTGVYLVARYLPAPQDTRLLTLPDLTGCVWDEATALTLAEDYAVTLRTRPAEAPTGTVLSTEPPGGAHRKLAVGERLPLTVTVSAGAEYVTLPDLKGCSAAEAIRALHALGLTVRQTGTDAGAGFAGRVVSLFPEPGTTLSPGDAVTISVGESKLSP